MPSTRKRLSGNGEVEGRELTAGAFGPVGTPLLRETPPVSSLTEAGLAEAGLAEAEPVEARLAEAGLAGAGPAKAGLAGVGLAEAGSAEAGLLVALLATLAGVADTCCGFQPRKRKALVTTHTELTLMAAAAIIGFRLKPTHANTPAATGMQMAL